MILLGFRMKEEGRERKKFKIGLDLFYSVSERSMPVEEVREALEMTQQLSITHLKTVKYMSK